MLLDLGTVTRETFAPYVDTPWRIHVSDDEVVEARLVEAAEWGTESVRKAVESGRRKRMPFRLTFLGPAGKVLQQRMYRVEHDAAGAFEPFLVTVGPDVDGMMYESIFV